MIDKLVKKHSALLALGFGLACAFVAPYFVPTDPDSALFRSGALGLLLILALYFPVRNALEKQPLRALIYGTGFALIFAMCMGLGCELEFYDRLLPGRGSLVRRFAAPVMLAPSLGALFSYAFTYTPSAAKRKEKPIPAAAFFAVFAVCYGLVLLALYPGVISYDFEHEILQFQTGEYKAAHPVFHTLFLGSVFSIGEAIFGSMTAGAALYSAVQLLIMAALYARACVFVQRRVSRGVTLLLAAGFALLPFHGVLAVSTAKDPLFSVLCVALCLQLWEIVENPDSFLTNRLRVIRFVLTCLFMTFMRHNGVFAYIPALLVLIALCRRCRRRMVFTVLLTLTLCLGIPKGMETFLQASKTPGSELMSIPCQQLMRTAARADLTQEEYDQISPWFSDAIHRYRENCADPAKGGNFDYARFTRNPSDFGKMYLYYGAKYPRIYAEAFLENTIGLWYPGDTSHAHTLSGEEGEYIYLNTVYPFPPETYPIEPECYFPALRTLLYATMHDSEHEDVPVLAQLYCPATYSFMLLFATLLAFYKKKRRYALVLTPMWGLLVSIFFAAGVFVRYTYPLMAAMPLLLAMIYFTPDDMRTT